MAAYIIVNVEVLDADQYADYTKLVGTSLSLYGGRFIVRGGRAERLEGSVEPKRVVVLEFPSVERAKAWWGSDEYREAKEIRQRSSMTDMMVVEGVN
jgi:uncharacterized protein (DUF1330 family)